MKIREVLQRKGDRVMTVRPTETVRGLAHRLRIAEIGAMVVSEDGQAIAGIVSERDITACVAQRGTEAADLLVSEIMSPSVFTCTPDDQISSIARVMTERRFRHIPVVDGGRLAGIVSIGDIVKHRLEEMELEAGVLRDLAVAGH